MMMMPRSPSGELGEGGVDAMCGRTWRIRSMVPRTLTSITKVKSEREKGVRSRERIWGDVRGWVELDWKGDGQNVRAASTP